VTIQTIKKLRAFVGPSVTQYLVLAVFVGLLLFCIEVTFAFALQGFLIGAGILAPVNITLPDLIPTTLNSAALALITVGAIRALLQSMQTYVSSMTYEQQKEFQRTKLVRWAFSNQSASSAELLVRYNDQVGYVSNFLSQVINITILSTAALMTWIGLFFISKTFTLISPALVISEKDVDRIADIVHESVSAVFKKSKSLSVR
jgi:hypothetical protein